MARDERTTDADRTHLRARRARTRTSANRTGTALRAAALLALGVSPLVSRTAHAQSATLDTERPPDLPHDNIPPPTVQATGTSTLAPAPAEPPERPHSPRFRWGVSGGFGAGFAINPFPAYPRAATGFGGAMFSLRLGSQRGLRDAVFYQLDSLFFVAPSARVLGFSLIHSINYERTERGGLYYGLGAAVLTSTAICTNCGSGPGFDISVGLPLRIGAMINAHAQNERRRTAVRLGVEIIPTVTVPEPSFFVPVMLTAGYEGY